MQDVSERDSSDITMQSNGKTKKLRKREQATDRANRSDESNEEDSARGDSSHSDMKPVAQREDDEFSKEGGPSKTAV